MKTNPVIECLMSHKSIRKFTDQDPDQETLETIVRAGQQAPFAGQSYSILLSRKREKNPFKAPLFFIVCWDLHKFDLIMKKRGWERRGNDFNSIWIGMQDVCYAAENMMIAGRSLGLGSCYIGSAVGRSEKIAEEYNLPPRVLPIVQLAMGYPVEEPPVRPRYPLEYTLFEDKYPELTDNMIHRAMKQMDEGYLAQDYYKKGGNMIPLRGVREETYNFKTYSWTEHLSRKCALYRSNYDKLVKALESRGFYMTKKQE
jgi:nitroreductase